MRLFFNDEESFKEAVESLRFINLPSDPNASQQFGSRSMMPLQEYESNGDNITPSDPITFRRVESSRTSSIQETRRSGDQVCFDNRPSNPAELLTLWHRLLMRCRRSVRRSQTV